MKWSNIFSAVEELSTDEVKAFLKKHQPEEFQLLDVRQPQEYSQQHLPGTILIPLNILETRVGELNPQLPSIVYCRSGARSRAACQYLRKQGFSKVFNMKGGMLAWDGQSVSGSEENGLAHFVSGDYASIYELACHLEAGLQHFYQTLSQKATDQGKPETAAFLTRMAQFEDGHINRLATIHNREYPDIPLRLDTSLVEGGLSFDSLVAAFGLDIETPIAVLELAMSFEAQAFDLYSRLERKTTDQSAKQFFHQMALEERSHLNMLAEELDKLLR